jgi:pimeloyl-ACP methyl ester carboxylesterase
VLLHGAWSDGREWRPQLAGLSDEFDVIAWDAPGCGGSDDPPPEIGAFAASDLRAVLPTVPVPTLLLYGAADVRAPRSVAEALHAAIPGSELVLLPEVRHMGNLEAPEAFNAEMRRFLRTVL